MVLIEEGIYYKCSRASIYYIKGYIAIVTLESKGCEIKLIRNIL
jgi:hypothetical protein